MKKRKDLKTVKVIITMKVRREIDLEELSSEIVDAVEVWGGQRHPDDALFYGISVQKIIAQERGRCIQGIQQTPRVIDE